MTLEDASWNRSTTNGRLAALPERLKDQLPLESAEDPEIGDRKNTLWHVIVAESLEHLVHEAVGRLRSRLNVRLRSSSPVSYVSRDSDVVEG